MTYKIAIGSEQCHRQVLIFYGLLVKDTLHRTHAHGGTVCFQIIVRYGLTGYSAVEQSPQVTFLIEAQVKLVFAYLAVVIFILTQIVMCIKSAESAFAFP